MEWVFDYFSEEENETAREVVESTGAIIMGRHTYEVEDRYRPGIYGGAWSGPYFVLTHKPPDVVPDWMTGTFIDEDIEAAVARARQAAGGKNVGILGANLAKQCLEHGLLDEIVIHLAPVLLGDGVPVHSPRRSAHPARVDRACPHGAVDGSPLPRRSRERAHASEAR
jgi:dihydrofolate reductase